MIRATRRLVAPILVAACAAGCAKAVNYPDPAGPLVSVVADGASNPGGSDTIRVVSFNIAYAIEIDRAIEVLRETPPLRRPDILALQEMDGPGTERIARALGMNAVYFPSGIHPKHDRDFGCAILSPWPLEAPRKLILPHGARGSGLRRAATSAVVVRNGLRIRAYSVHLPSPPAISGGSRKEQLRALAADADTAGMPVVIAGDFNSHGKVAELAKAGYDWPTKEVGGSTPFTFLGITVRYVSYDHILERGLERFPDGPGIGVINDNRGASDHRPIWAVFRTP